ncbi:hypothetical protein [Streptomyces olivaceoviridis]|uniref:hypothetical protein n=1 Tax=Streptomyces olivaceoviridis TaxID=1921 RepID=UPI00331AD305
MTSRAWKWTGVALCTVGAITLAFGAFVDLGKADQAASVTGGVVALVGLALGLVHQLGGSAPARTDVTASGAGSISAGGNIGSAATGGPQPPAPPASPAPTTGAPAPGSVTASGHGSIAAGGDIGSASTGP